MIAEIARRNSGLGAVPPTPEARQDEPQVRQRWQRWLRFGGGHDWRVLRRRMRAEGLRPSAVYQPRALAELPPWCATLEQLMLAARRQPPQALTDALPPGAEALPFATLLAPCLQVARQRLARLGPQLPPGTWQPDALQGMERALLNRLAQVAGPCLLAQFTPYSQVNPLLLSLLGKGSAPAPTGRYQAFVEAQLQDGYAGLFQRWPVLARLLASIVENWADACHEFLDRLGRDHGELRQRFFPHQPPAPVSAVDATLSDPHAGGRTVLRLGFADGTRLVYKPRPMEMEAIWSQAVAWLNEQGQELCPEGAGHRVPRVWARDDYGWMEWIEAGPMNPAEVRRYHWRMGSLLGLFRALNGADMHLENIVAAGAQPVFIDVECLLHPSARPLLEMPAATREEDWLTPRAVLHMGVMPFYGFSRDNLPHDLGAIGGPPSGSGPEAPRFMHVNSDWMTLQWAPEPLSDHHYPRTPAGWCNSLEHRQAVAAGFRATLSLLLARRDWLLDSPDSPWTGLRRARGRHLARTTWNYGTLLRGAMAPESLTDGVMFDLTFEPLHRHMALFSDGFRAMVPAEREDLRQLDVPRFGFAADSLELLDAHGRPLGRMHGQTPYASTAAGLRTLTPAQVAWEAEVLACALWPEDGSSGADAGQSATRLLQRCLQAPDGRNLWLSLGEAGEGLTVRPMEPGLYGGISGLALALACVGHARADRDLSRQAEHILMDALDQLPAPARGDAPVETGKLEKGFLAGLPGMGLDRGAAGILFALDQCARLSGATALQTRAERLARLWVSGPRLEALLQPARQFDYLNGAAGLLLVLLSLDGEPQARRQFLADARRCGDHLLQHARESGRGLVWSGPGSHGLSGLSHGGSGFAVALAALYRATGHRPYREAAFATLAHEATLFDPAAGNWRDVRGYTGADPDSVQRWGCSWCHGAPGIALSRAALLRLLAGDLSGSEQAQLGEELEVAVTTTRRVLAHLEAPVIDDLCCGTVGRLDILLECGRLADRPEWVEAAHQLAGQRLERWRHTARPRYWFTDQPMAGTDLSLFKGIASLAYLQARLEAPASVPCLLLPLPDPARK